MNWDCIVFLGWGIVWRSGVFLGFWVIGWGGSGSMVVLRIRNLVLVFEVLG